MLPDPSGKAGFVHFAGRDGKHGEGRIRLRYAEPVSVQNQEQSGSEECGPLVAVDERMILRKADCMGSCKIGEIRRPI